MKPRQVWVDMGYGPAENWELATVIKSEMTDNLFDDGKTESLLVQVSGGERMWVSTWRNDESSTDCKAVS